MYRLGVVVPKAIHSMIIIIINLLSRQGQAAANARANAS